LPKKLYLVSNRDFLVVWWWGIWRVSVPYFWSSITLI
jgi:hypothetical protein